MPRTIPTKPCSTTAPCRILWPACSRPAGKAIWCTSVPGWSFRASTAAPGAKKTPLNVYGKTRLAGEQAVLQTLPERACVVRTGWLFGPGKRNFVDDILNACHRRDSITIVDDRTGSPTYSLDLALWSIMLAERQATGLWHAVNSGQATWCELACEAVGLAGNECRVEPIPSSQWPQKAPRPPYTVLDCGKLSEYLGMHPRPWTQALREQFFCDPFDA